MALAKVTIPERMADAVATLDLNHCGELATLFALALAFVFDPPVRIEAVFPSSFRPQWSAPRLAMTEVWAAVWPESTLERLRC